MKLWKIIKWSNGMCSVFYILQLGHIFFCISLVLSWEDQLEQWALVSSSSANFDLPISHRVFSRRQIQLSESDEKSPNSSCTQNSEAGRSVKLSKCKSSFAGLKNSPIFFIASYFCQENGVKKHASVNSAFARIHTVHIFESLYVVVLASDFKGNLKKINFIYIYKTV